MMNLLLNNMLMLGIIRIQDLNRLPPALTLRRIRTFDCKAAQQCRQRASLRVHTSLYQLLRAAQVWVPGNEVPRPGHGRDPEAKEEGVSVLGCPGFGALVGGYIGFVEGFALFFALDGALLLGRVLNVVGGGGAVGGDDGWVC
jgi:hypothetical protein